MLSTCRSLQKSPLDLKTRIHREIVDLLQCQALFGRVSVQQIYDSEWLQVSMLVCSNLPPKQQIQQLKIKFKFNHFFPTQAPALFIQSQVIPHIFWYTNVLDSEEWRSQVSVKTVLLKICCSIQNQGFASWVKSLFTDLKNLEPITNPALQNSTIKKAENIFSSCSSFKRITPPSSLSEQDLSSQVSKKLTSSQINEEKQPMKLLHSASKCSKQRSVKIKKELKMSKRKDTKPMNKNANLPKFLIRVFIKYVDRFKECYKKKQYDKLIYQCRKMKEWKRHDRKQHAFGLKHLKSFFQDHEEGLPDPSLNRKIIISIIEKYILDQICRNSQIPETHRVGYLIACRVYSIRCRNAVLAGRIQSK